MRGEGSANSASLQQPSMLGNKQSSRRDVRGTPQTPSVVDSIQRCPEWEMTPIWDKTQSPKGFDREPFCWLTVIHLLTYTMSVYLVTFSSVLQGVSVV